MNQKSGGKFFNGFFWGAVLGGASAYVLSTKRGRDVVKELISEGVNRLEDAATPKKENIEKIISPIMEEEVVVEKEAGSVSDEEKGDSKKRFFKKTAKK